MSTQVRESLKQLLSSIRENLRPDYLENNAVDFGKKTLVIATGAPRQIEHLIEIIRKHDPQCQIYLIARPSLLSHIETSLTANDCAYPYRNSGFFDINGLLKEIPEEIIALLESVVGVFNNVWGVGYENIYAILRALNLEKSYTFNVQEKFSKVNPSIINSRIQSLTLNKTLSEWYWQYGLNHDN